jgi:membrane protease YdiL (CAAX protease family)
MHPAAAPSLPRASQLVWWPFAALLALLVAAELAADAAGGGEAWSQAAGNAWYLGWGAWAVWLCRRHGISIRRLVGRPRGRKAWGYVAMALPLLLLSAGLFVLQMVLASWVAPEMVRGWMADDQAADAAPLAGALGLLASVALAPAVEELVFRGVLLRSWTRRRGRTAALLGTAALFAVLHPADLVGSFVFGVVLGIIRLRTRTLLVPIACHALFNGMAEVLSAGPGGAEDGALTIDALRSFWWAGAACIAAASLVLWIFLRRTLPRRGPSPDGRSTGLTHGSREAEEG